MTSPRSWSWLGFVLGIGATWAGAADPPTPTRFRVMTTFGTVLRSGQQVVDDEGRAASMAATREDRREQRIYEVERTSGDLYLLKHAASGARGWARSNQIIPLDRAVAFYTAQIDLDPQANAYNARGSAWLLLGEPEIALADYNEAIRHDPEQPAYYINRGHARRDLRDYDRALSNYDPAFRLFSRSSDAHLARSFVRNLQRD